MQTTLSALLDALRASTTFEAAATAGLRPMLGLVEGALASSRYAGQGKLLRAMVHLRPQNGYRALAVLDPDGAQAEPASIDAERAAAASYLPSASAWRWVSERRAAVAIDVTLGRVEPAIGGPPVAIRNKVGRLDGALGRESASRLLERSATHLYVIPLRAPGGIVGMISIEAECRSAIGRPFVWSECGDSLALLADIAAPFLASLPPAPEREAPLTDDLLPALGGSMRGLIQVAKVFAQQDETLLISGPTGAGKSRLARWCHARSRRRARPFEAIDLLSVPDELQMGELFGWRKGAFSGAVTDNPGAIARADGGTLFLDEIDKLSMKAQAGLLHVLEERRYRPLGEGSGDKRRADVRFLVGTNANLEEAVKAGRFREDLYYRINVLPLRLPPLDERADELPQWASYMVGRRHAEGGSGGVAAISAEAIRVLEGRRWPGNLRQLDNVIRRAYAIALVEQGGTIQDVVIEEGHVKRALGYEQGEGADSLPGLFVRVAEAFVAEAERRREAGGRLDMDLADAVRGFILGAAARRHGSQEAAFQLLGKAKLVSHRNHKKVFRREIERVAELYRALGGSEPQPLADLLDEDR